MELLATNRGTRPHHLLLSLGAANLSASAALHLYDHNHHNGHYHNGHHGPAGQGQGHPANYHGPLGQPPQQQQQYQQGMPHQAMPYSDGYGGYGYGGGSGVGPMVPPALSGGGGGWYGNGYGYNVAMAAQPVTPEPGIDPGVAMVGAVRNVHVVLQPRSTVRQELALMFVQPGLYQLYVYDVAVVPEGADAGLWAGRPGQAPQPQRVYASVDRLHVLCL